MFVAIAASYVLVALLGFALGRISGELLAREARSWPPLPTPAPYDWAREGTLP